MEEKTRLASPAAKRATAPPPAQTNFTSVPVPLSGARVKLDLPPRRTPNSTQLSPSAEDRFLALTVRS